MASTKEVSLVRACRVAAASARRSVARSSGWASRVGNWSQASASLRSRQTRAIGLSSGPYGGQDTRRTCSGMVSWWAVWAPLLSRSRRFRRSGKAWANRSMQSWKFSACREGRAKQKRSALVGAPAPSTENHAKTCWLAPTGGTPQAVRRRRRTVSRPTRRSSWLKTRTGRLCSTGMRRSSGS